MKLRSQWVLPILTACVVLMAIVLPERISAWQDRGLFASAHVESFDREQGITAPDMSLEQRVQALTAVFYGGESDAYVNYQDSFSVEESEQIDRIFHAAANSLVENGVISLPKDCFFSDMTYGNQMRILLWDRSTGGTMSFLQLYCYDETHNVGIDLTIDEESGQAITVRLYYQGLEDLFAGDDGRKLAEIGVQFAQLLGFEPQETKYDIDDAYVLFPAESELPDYHVGQKYEDLYIEAMPDEAMGYALEKYDVSVSISAGTGEEIYDASPKMMGN